MMLNCGYNNDEIDREGPSFKVSALPSPSSKIRSLALRSRWGKGTRPQDVKIEPLFTTRDPFSSSLTLSVADLSQDMGTYSGNSKWRMFTLTGIMFLQNNGARNADQFENLVKSIGSKEGSTITMELLLILRLSVNSRMLIPEDRWKQILESCEKGKIV